jgi:hypothetical protein
MEPDKLNFNIRLAIILFTLTSKNNMENILERTTKQRLHLSVDIEMPPQVKFNQQIVQQTIELLLQNYYQAFDGHSPEQILHNLGIKKNTDLLDFSSQSESSSPNKWKKMLQRLQEHSLTPDELKHFNQARQEFRDNFVMRDVATNDNNQK